MYTQSDLILVELIILLIVLILHGCIFYSARIKQMFIRHPIHVLTLLILFGIILVSLLFNISAISELLSAHSQIILYYNNMNNLISAQLTQKLCCNFIYLYTVGHIITALLFISIIAIYWTLAFRDCEIFSFVVYVVVIMLGGTLLITTTNVVIMFCAYECLLLPSWYIIKKFAKTSRGEFAALSMLIWTQLGACLLFLALGLIFGGGAVVSAAYSVYNLSESTTNLLLVLISLGFGTKMPIFPFYWWLLDAHVEVSTNFSIILSGVSIKYAFIAYMRFLDWIGTASCCWPIFLLILYGFRDAMFRIDTECDIKRIVAYQTVVEMHLVAGLVMLNCDVFIDVIIFILGGHCWLSTASFIFVEIISRRYHTRNLELLYGIFACAPTLIKLLFILIFIGAAVPGTLLFSIEFLVQLAANATPFNFILFILMQTLVTIWSKNVWWSLWGGDVLRSSWQKPINLDTAELVLLLILVLYAIPPIFFIDMLV